MSTPEKQVEMKTEQTQVTKLPEDPKLKQQAIIITLVCAIVYFFLIYFIGY